MQGAVAVTNHIGLLGNFSYGNSNSNISSNIGSYHRHKFFEGGIGYFKNKDKWVYEIFAGYGTGEGSGRDSNGNDKIETASSKFQRYFIQPAFGLNKRKFQLSFVPRIALVDLTEFKSNVFDNRNVAAAADDPTLFIEPAAIGRFSLLQNRMFLVGQSGLSFALREIHYDYCPFYVSVGIGFRLGGVRKEVTSQTE